MKLIIGLGNPGPDYVGTRHNVGFMVLDELVSNENLPAFRLQKKFQAQVSEGQLGSEKIILAKPETFMNLSGLAVQRLAAYYKIPPKDVLVIHDEADLPLGTIRLNHNASAGGHNGVQSIINSLKSQEFVRVRIGISGTTRSHIPMEDYVLQKFSYDEMSNIQKAIALALEAIETTLTSGPEQAMNEYN